MQNKSEQAQANSFLKITGRQIEFLDIFVTECRYLAVATVLQKHQSLRHASHLWWKKRVRICGCLWSVKGIRTHFPFHRTQIPRLSCQIVEVHHRQGLLRQEHRPLQIHPQETFHRCSEDCKLTLRSKTSLSIIPFRSLGPFLFNTLCPNCGNSTCTCDLALFCSFLEWRCRL